MSASNPRIDARLFHSERPTLAAALIEQGRTQLAGLDIVAERCGVSPQYLRMLLNHQRKPSYAMQVCLEQITAPLPSRLVEVDATKHFRSHPSHVLALVERAESVCAYGSSLATLCGVSRQYIGALKKGQRSIRYPFQVLLEAIYVDRTGGGESAT